jgi:hypothetical protein
VTGGSNGGNTFNEGFALTVCNIGRITRSEIQTWGISDRGHEHNIEVRIAKRVARRKTKSRTRGGTRGRPNVWLVEDSVIP